MGGSHSRRKGAGGELELSKRLSERLSLEVKRTPQSGALRLSGDMQGQLRGDLYGVPGVHIECKRQEKISIDAWWKQTMEDCPNDSVPLLVFRRNAQKWRVVMDLDDWMDMYEASR